MLKLRRTSQLYRSLGEKCVFVMRNGRWTGKNDGDDVESYASPVGSGAQNVRTRGANNTVLLFRIDRALGRPVCSAASGFHLYKHQCFGEPGDDIDFTAPVRQAKVARHDLQALAAEISMRKILTLVPERLIRGQ